MLSEISDVAVIPSTFVQHLQVLPSCNKCILFLMTEECFVELVIKTLPFFSPLPKHSQLNVKFRDKVSTSQVNSTVIPAGNGST